MLKESLTRFAWLLCFKSCTSLIVNKKSLAFLIIFIFIYLRGVLEVQLLDSANLSMESLSDDEELQLHDDDSSVFLFANVLLTQQVRKFIRGKHSLQAMFVFVVVVVVLLLLLRVNLGLEVQMLRSEIGFVFHTLTVRFLAFLRISLIVHATLVTEFLALHYGRRRHIRDTPNS